MTHQWTVKGKRPVVKGNRNSEQLIRIECPDIPCVVYVGECYKSRDIQEALAQHIAETLSK